MHGASLLFDPALDHYNKKTQRPTDLLEPMFKDLANVNLLSHCSMLLTQNNNGSFNASIWPLVPKEVFSSSQETRLSLEMARLYYNQVRICASKLFFSAVGPSPSYDTEFAFAMMDNLKSCAEDRKSTDKAEEICHTVNEVPAWFSV